MEKQLVSRKTDFPAQLVQFNRFLRSRGFINGPGEEVDALQALAGSIPENGEAFRSLLAGVWVKNKDQHFLFPTLFQEYWGQLDKAENSKINQQEEEKKQPKKQQAPSLQELKNWLYNGRQQTEEEEIAAYSGVEVFTQKDFSAFGQEDVEEIVRIIRQFARWLSRQQRRRWTKTNRQRQIDLGRSIRKNLSRNSQLDYFLWRQPKPGRQKITLLCDVSKSMDLYARFLIQFMYAFHRVSTEMETFVFTTSLTRISSALSNREFGDSLEELHTIVPSWSGGTNIGRSFAQFREDYGCRHLGKETTVMILSDGWDQGDEDLLDEQMHFLQKSSRRIIWVNPLAGRPGYSPQTIGMKTAMPYVDYFTSAHNVTTLVDMVRWMK